MARVLDRKELAEGIWFALEQTGHLLSSAIHLFRAAEHSSAVALALTARDELGKYRQLQELWLKAANGTAVTTDDIELRHFHRQRHAVLSHTLHSDDDPNRQKMFERGAWTEIAEADARARKAERELAIYVDPPNDARGWSRPTAAFSRERAQRIVVDACNDYRVQFDHTNRKQYFVEGRPGLYEALEAWSTKPALPILPEPESASFVL